MGGRSRLGDDGGEFAGAGLDVLHDAFAGDLGGLFGEVGHPTGVCFDEAAVSDGWAARPFTGQFAGGAEFCSAA